MRRSLQFLLVDPNADFQTQFKREIEGLGSVEVATCSLGSKAALLADFIHFDAVFASTAADVPYDKVSERIRRHLADSYFFVYGEGAEPRDGFQPLAAGMTIAKAREVIASYA
jgi:hypothetical protein